MPRKTMPLTDTEVRNAKPKEKAYRLTDGDGLYLEVLPTGGKSWRFKYRFAGQEKRMVFGLWPEVGLKDARQRRNDARALVAAGADPGGQRRQEQEDQKAQAHETAMTFERVAREWHSKQVGTWSEEHAQKVVGRLERFLFPHVGSVPVAQLKAPKLLAAIRRAEAWGVIQTAQRLRQYSEKIYAYAVASGLVERNIGSDLKGALTPHRTVNRPAIVDAKAVGGLLRAVDGYGGEPTTRAALMLAAYTFVRPGELRRAEWAEIDLEAEGGPRWVIPGEKMKMGQTHIVPLSRQGLEVIEKLRPLTGHNRYLFPSLRGQGKCMSEGTLNGALRRMGVGQEEHCAHGFRAMASTLLNEQGWASDVIERQLAHAPRNKVRATYNRAEHLPERRKMMQAWADYLDGLKAGGKIIPIHRESTG